MSGVSWGRVRRFFIARVLSGGSLKAGSGNSAEFVRRPKLTARPRQSAARSSSASSSSSRPVASWGPRYRYDVDIWRALLLHPRPARISTLRGERVVLVTSNAAAGADLNRDIQAHCSDRLLWRRPTPLVHAILSYYKAAISRLPCLTLVDTPQRSLFPHEK